MCGLSGQLETSLKTVCPSAIEAPFFYSFFKRGRKHWMQELYSEFESRGSKVIALSIDTVKCHQTWIEDVKDYNKLGTFDYPIIADKGRLGGETR